MTDTIDRIIIQAESQGVQLTTDQVDALRVAMDTTGKSGTTLENKFGALERRLGTTAGEAQKAAKEIDTINKAVAQGNISQERANDALAAVALRYGTATQAAKELGDAHAGLSGQAQALQHGFRSIFDSLASGAPVTQVLGQEFGRLSYVMSGQGGVSGAFKELSGTFGGMLTPMNAVIGGAAALAAGALYLASSWESAKDEVNLALIGISQRTGTTAKDIADFTKANATATGLSVSEARNAALEFAKTGNVTISGLRGVGDAIKGYSLLTGKDATEATKAFVDAINNGLPGIEKLDERYGALNASTTQYIRALIESGDKTGALQVYMNATSAANKAAEESVGSLTKAYQALKNAISAVATGATSAPVSPQDGLKTAQAALDQAQAAQANASNGISRNSRGELISADQSLVSINELKTAAQDARDAVNSIDASNSVAQLNALSKAAEGDVNAILPQINAISQLNEKLRELQAAKDSTSFGGDAPGNTDAAIAVYQRQRDLQQESLDTTIRQAQAVNQLKADYGGVSTQTALALQNLELQLSVATQLTGASQQKAQAEATYEQLLTQGVKNTEAEAIAMGQLKLAQEQATTQVLKQVEALKDQDKMIKAAQNGTEGMTAAAIAYKNAINNGADATAAAALKAQTLKNYMDGAAFSASRMADAVANMGKFSIAGFPTTLDKYGVPYAPNYGTDMPAGSDLYHNPFGAYNRTATSGGGQYSYLGANPGEMGGVIPLNGPYITIGNTTDLLGGGTGLGGAASTTDTTAKLTTSLDKLTTSTNSLNATNQALLSPYYNQDPRTSHIGFRSQGMATGGYVDVPGGISTNDNMLAMIPVASGERITVDPQSAKRGVGGGSSLTINNNMSVTVVGNANKDDIGRTVYQTMQAAARQLAAAQR